MELCANAACLAAEKVKREEHAGTGAETTSACGEPADVIQHPARGAPVVAAHRARGDHRRGFGVPLGWTHATILSGKYDGDGRSRDSAGESGCEYLHPARSPDIILCKRGNAWAHSRRSRE